MIIYLDSNKGKVKTEFNCYRINIYIFLKKFFEAAAAVKTITSF